MSRASPGLPARPGSWLRADAPQLASGTDPALARRTLEGYRPRNEEQRRTRARMLAFLDEHHDALERACVPGHLTASALVVDAAGTRALLTLHAKLGLWLQVGGHCDGDGNLAGVALREAEEETGIAGLAIDPHPIDLDVHTIPARPGEPRHLHLDTRFVVRAPEGAVATLSPESRELRWFSRDEARALHPGATDASLLRLFELALAR